MKQINQTKLEQKTKEMAKKLSEMPLTECEVFLNETIKKIENLENEINENNKKIAFLQSESTKRQLTEVNTNLICVVTTISCVVLGGAVGLLSGSASVGVITATTGGFASMFGNIHSFEKKPASNMLNKIKVKILESKNIKLKDEITENKIYAEIAEEEFCK